MSDTKLRTHAEFAAVQEHGRRIAMRYLVLLGCPNQLAHDRFGIIASRRLGGAVTRNRAKRRLRELFWHARDDDARRAFDLVAIPRREFVDAPFTAIERDFRSALGKLRAAR